MYWLKNLILLVITLIIGFGIGESIVRFTFENTTLFPRFHSSAKYGEFYLRRLRPNSEFTHSSPDGSWEFVVNAQGFRDAENYTYTKPENSIRILVLGDSHTQGFEVQQEHTYSNVVERFLVSQGVNVQVMNTGISGFSTAEELVFLEQEGYLYDPDFVVLGFFGNDFDDNIKSGLFSLKNNQLIQEGFSHLPGVEILELHNSFGLLRWVESEFSPLFYHDEHRMADGKTVAPLP